MPEDTSVIIRHEVSIFGAHASVRVKGDPGFISADSELIFGSVEFEINGLAFGAKQIALYPFSNNLLYGLQSSLFFGGPSRISYPDIDAYIIIDICRTNVDVSLEDGSQIVQNTNCDLFDLIDACSRFQLEMIELIHKSFPEIMDNIYFLEGCLGSINYLQELSQN